MPSHFAFPSQAGYWRPWPGPDAVAGEVVDTSKGMGPKSLANTGVLVELQPGATEQQARSFLAVVQGRQARTDKMQTQFTFIPESLRDSFAKPELRRTLRALTARHDAGPSVLLRQPRQSAGSPARRRVSRNWPSGPPLARDGRQFSVNYWAKSLLLATLGGVAHWL